MKKKITMKNLLPFVFAALSLLTIQAVRAQCPYDNDLYLSGDAPANVGDGVYAPECWGGDMIEVTSMKAGYTYQISTCNTPTFDSELTIYPAGGGNALAYDDDGCGNEGGPSSIMFTCPRDGAYDILLDEYPCTYNFTDMDITIALVSTGGGQQMITIPVVVHVVWNTPEQNISDEQIESQIAVLNQNYRKNNDDFNTIVPQQFRGLAADCSIEFCKAQVDPNGNPTTGITRTHSDVSEFTVDDNFVKHSSTGGEDNWDPNHYLNLWVCNLGGGLLGYAAFPADLATNPSEDGVVISYKAFGTGGTNEAPYDLGRTAVHEVGHWLNLRHVWGDADCGDDHVDDTPTQEKANYSCPQFPHVTCNNGPDGDMFVNFMDYTDDGCMAMFTQGQKDRISATLAGARSGILSSVGCKGTTTGIASVSTGNGIVLYPNPSNGTFRFTMNNILSNHPVVVVYDAIGKRVNSLQLKTISGGEYEVAMNHNAPGIYFLAVQDLGKQWTSQFIIQ